MKLDNLLAKALCRVYLGEQTGKRGLLKDDLESYEKAFLQRSGTADDLARLLLITEVPRTYEHHLRISGQDHSLTKTVTFLRTTIEGAKKASEMMLQLAETSLLTNRLKLIPERVALFLIKYEILKMDGCCPVNPQNAIGDYTEDVDVQKGLFNCLFLARVRRMNEDLLGDRKKFFDALIDSGVCVVSSAYREYEEKRPTRTEIYTYPNSNYCVPPAVLNYLLQLYKSGLDALVIPEDLLQWHSTYHSIIKLLDYPPYLRFDGESSWGARDYDYSKLHLGESIRPISDKMQIQVLNLFFANRLLLLSDEEKENGKTWHRFEYDSYLKEVGIMNLEILCLKPILSYLYAKSNTKDGQEIVYYTEKYDVVVDTNNVAWDNLPPESKPKYEHVVKAIEYYRKKGLRAKFLCDASLPHDIDEPEKLGKILRRIVFPAPRNHEADEYVLKFAYYHPSCKIISNDGYTEWYQNFADTGDWEIIREVLFKPERFVTFKIDDEFMEFGPSRTERERLSALNLDIDLKTFSPPRKILPTTVWCEPEKPSENRHSFIANEVYLTTDGQGLEKGFVVCPTHNRRIPVEITRR